MSVSDELPEHQIFYILRQGEEEPIGPYSQKQLVELLNDDTIKSSDFVYYEELSGWKPLSQVFDLHQEIANFGEEGQDQQVVSDSFAHVTSRSPATDEEVYYIAVQHVPAMSLTKAVKLSAPKSLALTNYRFCVINPKLMGTIEFDEYPIDQIEGAMKRSRKDEEVGLFNIVLKSGDWIEIDKIPAAQLERLEEIAGHILETKNES